MSIVQNSTKKGTEFEELMYRYFAAEIRNGRFFAKPQCCKVRKNPKYHSRDRSGDITFDVSIEIFLPGSTELSAVVLIECKNYTKAVPVDDAEEFFAKVQQVAPAKAKAVLASKASFQLNTRKFAQAKGIGLLRYFSQDNCKWELRRSPSGSVRTGVAVDVSEIVSGLTNPDHISEVCDLYLQSPTRDTNSLNDFLRDLLLDDAFSPSQLREITNTRTKRSSIIPFIEKDELENIATGVLQDISYTSGKVPLQHMCKYEASRSGLIVNHNVKPRPEFINRQVLGRITFDPPKIEIYHQANRSPGRLRFTLAHELAHHLLGHGKFMRREYCQDRDFSIEKMSTSDETDIARMEVQANFLASNMLLPKHNVIEDFKHLIHKLELLNRGYGSLYLDKQPCNIQNFEQISAQFMRRYGVSRAAVTIRLQALGLLHDVRQSDASHRQGGPAIPFQWP